MQLIAKQKVCGIPMIIMTDGSRKGYRHVNAGSTADNRKQRALLQRSDELEESSTRKSKPSVQRMMQRADVCWKCGAFEKALSVCCIHFLIGKTSHSLNFDLSNPFSLKQGERSLHDSRTRTTHMNEWQKRHSRLRDAQRSVTMGRLPTAVVTRW